MSTDEPDLFDRLRAVVLNAEKLDRGTQIQLNVMLEAALERILEDDDKAAP